MLLLEIFLITIAPIWVSCTISGLNYMEPLNFKPFKSALPGEDPCNPLYWYPRNIPESCYYKTDPKSGTKPKPIPVPIPAPLPRQSFPFPLPPPLIQSYPVPPPYPIPLPYPIAPPYPLPPSLTMPAPIPMFPPPIPLPYGIPIEPTNPMLPVAGVPGISAFNPFQPYGGGRPLQAGMVPGLPGLVTDDGGINILPFSDAYADVLEKHKQKMMRKKLQRLYDDYVDYPTKRRHTKYERGILH